MPYCEIPTESLAHIQLFGIRIIESNDEFMLVQTSRGEELLKISKPVLWLDDLEDAYQLKARGIFVDIAG